MHASGYNSLRYNREPYNGRGRYSVVALPGYLWNVSMAAITVLATQNLLWSIRQRVGQTASLLWSLTAAVLSPFGTAWDITSGLLRLFPASWTVRFPVRRENPLSADSEISRLSAHGVSGSVVDNRPRSILTRHQSTSDIGE